MPVRFLSTAKVARAVGCHPNTVRMYEEWGLIPPVPRNPAGYRVYELRHLNQMRLAHYPVSIYPPWLRIILTWVIPIGVITTIPAQVLTGIGPIYLALLSLVVSAALLIGASLFFRSSLRHYSSASS